MVQALQFAPAPAEGTRRVATRFPRRVRGAPPRLLESPRARRWLAIVVPWSEGSVGAGGRLSDDEAASLQRAANGDAAAFRVLFARHRVDVQRLVFRMVGARPDLDDIVQEVFIQVYRSLRDFRGQSKFSTWLHRVTVNVVLMHRRAARSRPTYTEEAPDDLAHDAKQVLPDEAAARHERMRAFGRLLDRLADKKRIVFVLHELEGKAPAEIAEIVGAPVLTVRTRLFYARRELEAMWQDEPSLKGLDGGFSRASAEEDS
ncbi:MAG: RNA polymerase sigma factor [Myxococcales bacterium]|jgi:RNA polymerase sigma-70 factor (ECF subfamily)|nr:RNA polymerase sigma factor [Myxococcales bacterium]